MKKGPQCHIVTGELNFSGTHMGGVLKIPLEKKIPRFAWEKEMW